MIGCSLTNIASDECGTRANVDQTGCEPICLANVHALYLDVADGVSPTQNGFSAEIIRYFYPCGQEPSSLV
jgi:hypothetical protein